MDLGPTIILFNMLVMYITYWYCNVPPPRGQVRLHLVAFLGHRLPSQTNTSLFRALCPHAPPGRTSRSVTHRSRPSTLNLGVICRWASGKEVATY